MPSGWLPLKDSALQSFGVNFSAKISASPTSYGLTAADATNLATYQASYTSALATSSNPTTRTKTAVVIKNTNKAQLAVLIRSIAKRVQANPAVTSGQRTDLGLPIHSTTPTPIPPPDAVPAVILTPVVMGTRTLGVKIVDSTDTSKRARPAGTAGAEVYSFVSDGTDTPPGDLEDWRFEGMATKNNFDIAFRTDDVGKTATIVARWYNTKGEVGPVSNPITGTIAA